MSDKRYHKKRLQGKLLRKAGVCFVALTASFGSWSMSVSDPLGTKSAIQAQAAYLPIDARHQDCLQSEIRSDDISLEQAFVAALCNSPQVRSTWYAMMIQSAAVGEVNSAYLPVVTLSRNELADKNSRQANPLTTPDGRSDTTKLSLSLRLFDFGVRSGNLTAERHLLVAAEAEHIAGVQTVLQATIEAYADFHVATNTLKIRRDQELMSEQALRLSKRQQERGYASMANVIQAMVAVSKAQLERDRAEGALQQASELLKSTIGIDQRSNKLPLTIAVDKTQSNRENLACYPDGNTFEKWLVDAATEHPAVQSVRAQWLAATEKVSAAQAELYPTIDLSVSRTKSNIPSAFTNNSPSLQSAVNVGITVPLFNGFSGHYKIQKSVALAEQKEQELRLITKRTIANIVKLWEETRSTRSQLEIAAKLVTLAERSTQSVLRRLELGAADMSEVLVIQNSLLDASLEETRLSSAQRFSHVKLLAGLGRMGTQALHLCRVAEPK
jgi:outer membrane protein